MRQGLKRASRLLCRLRPHHAAVGVFVDTPHVPRDNKSAWRNLFNGRKGVLSYTERNTSMDRGTVLRSRFDGKCSVQHFQSLLHADEAKPLALFCRVDVKTGSKVANRKTDIGRCLPEPHFEVPHPAM